jgi:pimeloyl-ACP methyl ester carboxylesterase
MPLLERDGCSVEYFAHGRKTAADGTPNPVITFVHGGGGNGFTWCFNIPSFVSAEAMGRVAPDSGLREYFVIAFVMRGWGGSRVHSGNPLDGWTPENVVGDLLAVLDAEGVKETAMVCHSFGGFLGVHAAFAAPDRVSALVMFETFAGLTFSDEEEHRLLSEYQDRFMATFRAEEEMLETIRAKLADASVHPGEPLAFLERQKGYKSCVAKNPEVFNLRWGLGQSNHQMQALGKEFPTFMHNMLRAHSIGVDSFRAKFGKKLHFISAADDATAFYWELVALFAERANSNSIKVFEAGKGDHSIMMFGFEEFNQHLREILDPE